MRVLIVGGSGYVAGLVRPLLAARHELRVLDREAPPDGVAYLAGTPAFSVTAATGPAILEDWPGPPLQAAR